MYDASELLNPISMEWNKYIRNNKLLGLGLPYYLIKVYIGIIKQFLVQVTGNKQN